MQWLLLGVMVIALLLMSSRYPKTAFGILAALGLAAAIIVFSTREDAMWARHKLPVADLKIENAIMVAAYGGSYQFNARLVNANRSITLREFVVSVTMLDCANQDEVSGEVSCVTIGQIAVRINAQIPPEQARDISRNLFFNDAAPAGTIRWQYQITETRS